MACKITEDHPVFGKVEHTFANREKAEEWIKRYVNNYYNMLYWQEGSDKAHQMTKELEEKLKASIVEE